MLISKRLDTLFYITEESSERKLKVDNSAARGLTFFRWFFGLILNLKQMTTGVSQNEAAHVKKFAFNFKKTLREEWYITQSL